jgi:hypothetical protein
MSVKAVFIAMPRSKMLYTWNFPPETGFLFQYGVEGDNHGEYKQQRRPNIPDKVQYKFIL